MIKPNIGGWEYIHFNDDLVIEFFKQNRVDSFPNIIDKFPFSSDANATDVGDLTVARNNISEGQNSSSNGYISGGFSPTIPGTANIIEKFPFGSDANATDVGDLTAVKSEAAGQQV